MVYALKEMNKPIIVAKGAFRIANNEVRILQHIPRSNFIVNLWHAFQDENNAYLLMDYAPWGDLLFHMKRLKSLKLAKAEKGGTFTEEQGKFIAACILEGLRAVHGAGIVHRDIKPDNIIIDSNGYPKLADFGIAEFDDKIVPGSQYGTLNYMAPEIMFEHTYGYTVDYYSLGVLLLLMVTGDMLSVGKTIKEAKKNISLRRDTMTTKRFAKRYPYLSEEWCDFIVKLLTTSQHRRIGKTNQVQEVLEHEWFQDIDLKAIQDQTLHSPIYEIATDEEAIKELTSFETGKGEETLFWLQKEKKAMRMISKSYVDYGNYWKSNFGEFEFLDVNDIDNEGNQMESSAMIRRHTMSSILKRREESMSYVLNREALTATPSEFTWNSTYKSDYKLRRVDSDKMFNSPDTRRKSSDADTNDAT